MRSWCVNGPDFIRVNRPELALESVPRGRKTIFYVAFPNCGVKMGFPAPGDLFFIKSGPLAHNERTMHHNAGLDDSSSAVICWVVLQFWSQLHWSACRQWLFIRINWGTQDIPGPPGRKTAKYLIKTYFGPHWPVGLVSRGVRHCKMTGTSSP